MRLTYLFADSSRTALFRQPLLDEDEAVEAARGLLAGRGFGPEPFFKAPGYSTMLAAIIAASGEQLWPWTARITQHVLGALAAAIACAFARRMVRSGRSRDVAGAVAGAAIALYAPLIRLESTLSLDAPLFFFQALMLWLLAVAGLRNVILPKFRNSESKLSHSRAASLHPAQFLGGGVVAAIAWLIRPTLLAALPFIAIWIFWLYRRGCTKPLLAFFLPLIAAFLWVIVRNAAVGGEAMLLPWQGGYNLYEANRPGATGRYLLQDKMVNANEVSSSVAQAGKSGKIPPELGEKFVRAAGSSANPARTLSVTGYRAAIEAGNASLPSPSHFYSSLNSYWSTRARQAILGAPIQWLGLMARKAVYLFSDKEIYNYEDYDLQKSKSLLLKVIPGRFGILLPFALAGLATFLLAPGNRRAAWALLALYAIGMGGGIALYFASGRLRMPLVFPAAVFAGAGVGQLWAAARLARHPARFRFIAAAYTVLLFLGAALAWGNWWGVRSESMAHADLCRMSNAAWLEGNRLKEAAAGTAEPAVGDGRKNLSADSKRRYQEALQLANDAEVLKPGYPQAAALQAQALQALGRYPEALNAYADAAKRTPDQPQPPYNMAIILDYDLKRPAEAARLYADALQRDPAYYQAAWRGALCMLRLNDTANARTLLQPFIDGFAAQKNGNPAAASPPALFRIAAAALECRSGNVEKARAYAAEISAAAQKELRDELESIGAADCAAQLIPKIKTPI